MKTERKNQIIALGGILLLILTLFISSMYICQNCDTNRIYTAFPGQTISYAHLDYTGSRLDVVYMGFDTELLNIVVVYPNGNYINMNYRYKDNTTIQVGLNTIRIISIDNLTKEMCYTR